MSDPFAQTVYAPTDAPSDAAAADTPALDTPAADAPPAASVAAPTSRDTGPQRIADRYEVLGLIGAGGMGNVYRVKDLELGEIVALKMLRPEIGANPAALDRFRLEVKLARRVTHPHVARTFDIGEHGGEKYLTMELVDGEPLSALLRRAGRLSPARAVAIAKGICQGLGAAHAAGVVHRDLKPDNVLLAKDGRTVVTDFGIAQAAGADGAREAGFVGTPSYMAPEQVEGKAAGPGTDLYALGVMLYEMVTGELPWTGDSVFAVAAARVLHPPPDACARRPGLPRELGTLIRTLMARAPEDRYPSAQVLMDMLAAVPVCDEGAPAKASTLPVPRRGQKQIAVLPLRNAGPAEDDFIADGLTEDLIDQLSAAPDVRVRARGTVARFRDADRDPREIGRELDVQVVASGTVRRTSAGVRVSVRLVSVADGVQIWHKRFDRRPEDMLSVSDDAARAVAEALAVSLEAPERAPTSPEAIELYLRARALFTRFFSDTKGESVQLFQRARALAPDDTRILAGYALSAARSWMRDPSMEAAATEAAESAMRRAPDLPESQVAYAMVRYQERREPEAMRTLRRAVSLAPNNSEAHDMIGRMLAETRLQKEARAHLDAALAIEPETHLARLMVLRIHMIAGEWDAARALVLGGDPESESYLPPVSRYCLWCGDVELARATLVQVEKKQFDWPITRTLLAVVAYGAAPWDRLPKAGTVSNRFYGFVCQVAAECAGYLGDAERALDAIERADDSRFFDLAWMEGCPLLAKIRGTPRFEAVRARVEERALAIQAAYTE